MKLVALDFGSDIRRLTGDFTGREWLLKEVDAWLKRRGERFFILTGEPGVGKSAFAAWLTRMRKDIAAWHFCIAGRNDTIVPNTVLRSLGAQLGHYLPDYGKALANTIKPEKVSIDVKVYAKKMTGGKLTGVIIEHLHASDPKDVLEITLRAPLAALPAPDSPRILLIDSLDEAITYRRDLNLVTLLSGLDDLPPWVRILCTSRPERSALCYFDGLSAHIFAAESKMNLEDVEQYITNRVGRKAMQARIKTAGKNPEDLSAKLKDEDFHKGNFLFMKILLDDIEAGRQSLEDLNALPKSINEIYHGFLRRFKAQWEKRYQPILGILAVAREPISEAYLSNFTRIKRTQMRQSLGEIIQFLDEHEVEFKDGTKEKTYELYHRSFRDYLLDEERNVDFWCAPVDGHQSIADSCWALYRNKWSSCSPYGMRHLPYHMNCARQFERLKLCLLDFEWLRAKLTATSVVELLDDFEYPAPDASLDLLHSTISLGSEALSTYKGQLPAQLLGRLVCVDCNDFEELLRQAREWRGESWLRPLNECLQPPGRGELFVLGDDTQPAAVIPPDGQRLIAANRDGSLRIWSVSKGSPLLPALRGHSQQPTVLRVTSDGRKAVSASPDGTICTWDLADHLELVKTYGIPGGLTCIDVTPDARRAILAASSSPETETLSVWDLENDLHVPLQEYRGPKGCHDLLSTPDSRNLLAGSEGEDQSVGLWDLNTGKKKLSLAGWSPRAISPDGSLLVTGDSFSKQCNLKVWNLTTGEILHTLVGHKHIPYFVHVLKCDGACRAVAGDLEGQIIIWDLTTGRPLLKVDCDTERVTVADQENERKNGKEVHLLSQVRRRIREWCYEVHRQELRNEGGHRIDALVVSADGSRLASVSSPVHVTQRFSGGTGRFSLSHNRKTLIIWDLIQQKIESTCRFIDAYASDDFRWRRRMTVSFASGGERVVTVGDRIRVFDKSVVRKTTRQFSHKDSVSVVAITRDSENGISGSSDGTVAVWDMTTGRLRTVLPAHSDEYPRGVLSLAPTPDSRSLVSSGYGTIKIWDLNTGQLKGIVQGHKQGGGCVAVGSNPPHIIVACHDNSLRTWGPGPRRFFGKTIGGYRLLHQLSYGGTHFWVGLKKMKVSLSIDGQLVAANPYYEGSCPLGIWEVASGKCIARLPANFCDIQAVAITKGNERVVSAWIDGCFEVWDYASQSQCLTRKSECADMVDAVVISQDGSRIVFAARPKNADLEGPGIIEVWDTEKDDRLLVLESGSRISRLAVTPDGSYGSSVSQDRTVEVWDFNRGQRIGAFEADECLCECATASNGSAAIAGDVSGGVYLLRVVPV